MIYYVKKDTGSLQLGTKEHPFWTISEAAELAMPGDTILIGDGIYREWVSPSRGGNNEDSRIIYRNMEGQFPVISGAEILSGWEQVGEHLYRTAVPRSDFGEQCPFDTLLYGDWYDSFGQVHHTGEVYADGQALYEAASLAGIANQERDCWFAVCDEEQVVFWVYMRHTDPAEHIMEISVRPFGFFPKEEQINYITVSGLRIENVATQWAPPTAFQAGAIGTHWSKGWIIENCTVRNSKCVGISIGKRKEEQDNRWSRNASKGGAQTYTEVIFENLRKDWKKDTVGGHVIRNNTICHCGQAGIVGCMGGAFSTIENNHIYAIGTRSEFGGFERAGIKLHAGIDVQIKHNMVHDTPFGLWLDWEAQGARVSGNLFFNNAEHDVFVEVCHGPLTIDNNLLLSPRSIRNTSQGTAIVHNLIAGENWVNRDLDRFTMYHFPHDTAVRGSIVVYGGDDRVYNNVYVGSASGNAVYNGYHDTSYVPDTSQDDTPMGIKNNTLGVAIRGNAYFGGAQPCAFEKEAAVFAADDAFCRVRLDSDGYWLETNLCEELLRTDGERIDTQFLGRAFESDAEYENPDGTPLTVDEDFFGHPRKNGNPRGPFARPVSRRIYLCGAP